ncbi:hypothetical protein RO3G_08210 [Rhizopus delemar RA 99-880]|uniref:Tc1-like transposase DDE domain-containing protein n=1 Tax=Rhizopus delemar (strain RA 99-880 / ATCC MYA-4621 / FGSC 9543 / NRRL 43880) TaxID=246409 RepID=I1C4X5_RHIO9|nr:hypothetical protein RO3G_08210 [Rhizopus delemar RA 99-880]|eukprot:EIE83505.1 hypothetical protein RO3G_08210 [Rhizopus delemar RA 99-880]
MRSGKNNAAIHKVAAVQELIERREYKDVYLPPYSSFLDPIELFWSKVKAGVFGSEPIL